MKTFGRLIRNFAFTLGLVLTLLLIISALAAPLLSPHDPYHQDTARRLEAPSDTSRASSTARASRCASASAWSSSRR
jgi:ABC-type dipeptide/oligopeptide/nickel transport system permease subunit